MTFSCFFLSKLSEMKGGQLQKHRRSKKYKRETCIYRAYEMQDLLSQKKVTKLNSFDKKWLHAEQKTLSYFFFFLVKILPLKEPRKYWKLQKKKNTSFLTVVTISPAYRPLPLKTFFWTEKGHKICFQKVRRLLFSADIICS